MKNFIKIIRNIPYRTAHFIMKGAIQTLKLPVPSVLKGSGMVRRFPEIIKIAGVTKILVVTDRPLFSTGLLDPFLCTMETDGIEVVIYDKVQPNPTIENAEEGLALYQCEHCNGIVAFGGGSPLDCGKIIAARVTNRKSIAKMHGSFKLIRKLPPFFAVPTTAGTGSEATISAFITDVANHQYFAINDPKLVPLATVLDPELTLSLPPSSTASTGMNALTHGIEAYIGKYDTPFVKEKALSATAAIIKDLEACYQNGLDENLRLNLAQASFESGLALARAHGGYVHAIAHAVGGCYGTPQSLANAIILPYILDFSRESAEKKLAQLAFYSGLGQPMDDDTTLSILFIKKIKAMNEIMGIPRVIEALKANDILFLARCILKEANPAYPVPRIMDFQECCNILKRLCPETSQTL